MYKQNVLYLALLTDTVIFVTSTTQRPGGYYYMTLSYLNVLS